jgi:hypothetical protein
MEQVIDIAAKLQILIDLIVLAGDSYVGRDSQHGGYGRLDDSPSRRYSSEDIDDQYPELVGVETNPGPKKGAKGKKKGKQVVMTRPQGKKRNASGPKSLKDTYNLRHVACYLRTLNNPFTYPPCRPGVDTALPTGLCTSYLRSVITTSGAGNCSMVFYPGRVNNPFMYSSSAGAPYTFGAAAVQPAQSAQITSLYEKVRVLACGVRIRPVQPATANQGTITAALLGSERGSDTVAYGIVTTAAATFGFNEYGNFQSSVMVRFADSACAFWRPQDPNSFVFSETALTDSLTAVNTIQGVPFIVMGIAGAAATANFIVELVIHYEGYILGGNAGVIAVDKAPATAFNTVIGGVDKIMPSNVTAKSGSGDNGFNEFQSPSKPATTKGSKWTVPEVIGGVASGAKAGYEAYQAAVSFGDELAELLELLLV